MQIKNEYKTFSQLEVKKPEEASLTRREAFAIGAAGGAAVTWIPHTLSFVGNLFEQQERKAEPVFSVPSEFLLEELSKTNLWLEGENRVSTLFQEKMGLEKPKVSPLVTKRNISLDLDYIKKLYEERNRSNASLLTLWTLIRLRAQHNKENKISHSITNLGWGLKGVLSYLRPDCDPAEIADVAGNRETGSQLAKALDEN